MKRLLLLSGLLLASLLISTACGAPPAAPPAGDTNPAPGATKASQADVWNNLVAEAKKEGELTIYWEGSPDVQTPVAAAFKQKYGIQLNILAATGAEVAERMSRERAAGIYNPDVIMVGHYGMLIQLKPAGLIRPQDDAIILPEVSDPKAWIGGKFPWGDAEHFMVKFGGTINSGLWRNSDLVAESEVKEYRDLLNPKWKGKIVMQDPTVPGAGSAWFRLYYPVLGDAYMKELVKQEPQIIRDKRLVVEWVARGKNPISLCGNTETLFQLQEAGSPLQIIYTKESEYVSTGPGAVGMAARPPHPNAARVYINWLLSQEGQTVWSKGILFPSFRADVPTTHLNQAGVPKNGKVYLSDTAETLARSEEMLNLSKQVFAPLLPK